ncbi:MAG: hypothetical protein LBL55_09330 [Propionibacteriaceae bacterium]|nr:hypothetical protein [Propionibacteriaceae bacterium]
MFDDPVEWLRAYLTPILDCPALGGVPHPRPPRFVRLLWTGTRRQNVAFRLAQVTAEAWDEAGMSAAAQLGSDLHDALDRCPLLPRSSGWAGGPYNDTDPDTGTPKTVMTVQLKQRARHN